MTYHGRAETGYGWLRATWPFARLEVDRDKLSLRALFMGRLSLTAADVIEVKEARSLPFFSSGVAIKYHSAGRIRTAWFFGLTRPSKILADTKECGFRVLGA
jgi:hypothetical protein